MVFNGFLLVLLRVRCNLNKLKNLHNHVEIWLKVGVRCFCSHLFETTCWKILHHRNFVIDLNKEACLKGAFELLSFKNSIYRETNETFTNWNSKKTTIKKWILLRTFEKQKFYLGPLELAACNLITEITDIKSRLLSKLLLFQRMQEHGSYTKLMGNDKFV